MQEAELLERRCAQNAVHVSWKLGEMMGVGEEGGRRSNWLLPVTPGGGQQCYNRHEKSFVPPPSLLPSFPPASPLSLLFTSRLSVFHFFTSSPVPHTCTFTLPLPSPASSSSSSSSPTISSISSFPYPPLTSFLSLPSLQFLAGSLHVLGGTGEAETNELSSSREVEVLPHVRQPPCASSTSSSSRRSRKREKTKRRVRRNKLRKGRGRGG